VLTGRTESTPRAVLAYGLLGIIPFWSITAARLLAPPWTGVAAMVETAYAALILSFLGGARWGLEVRGPKPDPWIVGLAMTPTLAGLAALVFLQGAPRWRLLALAALLALAWAWDTTAKGLPPWYARLRTILTVGAIGGLCVGALQLTR
jgi:hypothetical protein